MADSTVVARAQRLKELHAGSGTLVLPTVWDVWTAKLCVDAGFDALTIGSHPLADSHGRGDNEGQTFEEVLADVAPIVAAVDVPVSVDLEAGYGREPAEIVAGLLDAGGAGLNIEDTVHSEGGRVRSAEEHAAYIGGLRAAADDAGVPVVVNGRTDLFMHAEDRDAVLDEGIARLRGLAAAGADCVYPVRIHDSDALISAVVDALDVPVNITAHPVQHDLARLEGLGVGRVSYGPLLMSALTDYTRDIVGAWRR